MKRAILFTALCAVRYSVCCRVMQAAGAAIAAGKKSLTVVTSLFPLYDFARAIAKDKAAVSLLLPPGVESHSFEPRPGDILQINSADLFIYTGAVMEPWVAKILQGNGK